MRTRLIGQFACFAIALSVGWLVLGPENAAGQGTTGGQTGGGGQSGGGFGSGTGGQGTGGLGSTGNLGGGTSNQGTTGGTGSGGISSMGNTGDFALQTETGLSQLQQNAQANQAEVGFVGGPNADAQNATFSVANPDGAGQNNTFSAIDSFFRQINALNSSAGNVRTSRRVIRGAMRVGFAVSRPSDATIATRFMERFERNPILREVGQVEATLDNEVLTLTGVVRSPDQRIMVEQQALLEPGVARVNNQLTVLTAND